MKALDPLFDFTEEEFNGACILVQSRLFGVTIGGKSAITMVPMADMHNHNSTCCKVKWLYDNARKGFVMKAEEDIQRGEQVFISYGVKDDASFLLNYGFLPEVYRTTTLVRADLDPNGPFY